MLKGKEGSYRVRYCIWEWTQKVKTRRQNKSNWLTVWLPKLSAGINYYLSKDEER